MFQIWIYVVIMKTSLPSSLEKHFFKVISNIGDYKNTFCYGKHIKFSNDSIRWFKHNISKDVGDYNNLSYEHETDVDL